MTDVLNVVKRETRGTKRMRRLRQSGLTPAILYGHGEDNVMLSVKSKEVALAVRQGHQFVKLSGDLSEDVLLKSVQWDAFGSEVMHVDFARVGKGEQVEVEVTVELRGNAAGESDGGMVEQLLHAVTIRCPAQKLPDSLEVNINELALGDSVSVSDLTLPAGATTITPETEVVVQCVQPSTEEPTEEAEATETAEPEVVGEEESEASGEEE